MMREFQKLAEQIQAYEFDTVFTLSVTPEGFMLSVRHDVYAPDVFHDDAKDVVIDGNDWEALTGFTGQSGYWGAVNHPSEYIGMGVARELVRLSEDEPQSFVMVTVEVDSPEDEDPAGWAILRYLLGGECQWYLMCENKASVMLPHPILGHVPTCARCAEKDARLRLRSS